MAIESANVSKPAIHEVEKTSGSNPWSSLQGSSTEGKDRPFDSIWEKAVDGTQKLFGSATTKQTPQSETLEEDEEKQEPSTSSEVVTPQESFSSVPGFGGSSFSYFSAGHRRMGTNIFATPSTGYMAPETVETRLPKQGEVPVAHEENYDVASPKVRRDDAAPVKEKARYQQKEKMTDDDDESESSEKKASESKSPISVSSRRTVTTAPIVQSASASPVLEANQGNTQVAQEHAVPAQSQASVAATPVVKTAQSPAAATSILEASKMEVPAQFTTSKQTQSQPQALVQSLSQQSQAQVQPTVAKPVPVAVVQQPNTQTTVPTVQSAVEKTGPATPVQIDAAKTVDVNAKASDATLVIAPEKANQALTEAVKKTVSMRSENTTTKPVAQPVQVSSTTQPLTTVQGEFSQKSAQVETVGLKVPEQVGEVKGSPTQDVLAKDSSIVANKAGQGVTSAKGMPSAEQSALARQQAVVESVPEASTASSSQRSRSASTTAAAAVGQAVRPTGVQSQNRPLGQNGTTVTNVAGVSAGTSTTAGVNSGSAGAQAQNGEAGDGLKQDLSAQLKNASSGKSADKGSGDSGQAFDVKGLTSDSSRKGEAAAKARPTSYVSKTVEEMKEVVATLTKSIDRLVTTKPGTMNLKINFDQGGSMNLRITLDGSQVSTSMQTDVPGLEGMIKSNWSDLAGDWNQKGVKLNTPQFQQSADSSSDSKGESWNEFTEKQQNRQSGFNGSSSRGAGRKSENEQSSSNGSPSNTENDPEARQEVISDTEIKTYA